MKADADSNYTRVVDYHAVSRLMKNARLGYRERAGVGIAVLLGRDSGKELRWGTPDRTTGGSSWGMPS